MLKIEKKFLFFLETNKEILFFLMINLLGVIIRLSGVNFVSGDAWSYLLPWYNEIKGNGGLAALGKQVGNYGIPYQFLIAVMTYIPIKWIYLFKILSGIFDFLLAFSCARFVCSLSGRKSNFLFLMVYGSVLILPSIVLNSSIWGQCDAIYVFFIMEALYCLYNGKNIKVFIFIGIAFAFKLQTIFIMPFLIYYYIKEKKFSITNFCISLVAFYVMQLPGIFMGRSLFDPFRIYASQTNYYKSMWSNFMSFWVLIGNNSENLSLMAMMLTIGILGIGLLYLLNSTVSMSEPKVFIKILIWSVWTCVLFLTSMHDRYAYLLDLLLTMNVFLDKKFFKYAVVTLLCSLDVYGNILFGNGVNIKILSVIYTIAYLLYSYEIFKQEVMNHNEEDTHLIEEKR